MLLHQDVAQNPIFLSSMRMIREGICEQVVDLRSSIPREACAVLTALATAMGDAFNPFVESFISPLMKIAGLKTPEIVSLAANSCIESIVRSTKVGYPKALTKYDIYIYLYDIMILSWMCLLDS